MYTSLYTKSDEAPACAWYQLNVSGNERVVPCKRPPVASGFGATCRFASLSFGGSRPPLWRRPPAGPPPAVARLRRTAPRLPPPPAARIHAGGVRSLRTFGGFPA